MAVRGKASESGSTAWWRTAAILAGVIVVAGIVWWLTGRGANTEEQVTSPVVCLDCGYEGSVPVGETPSLEEWPRECPNCHKKTLYMSLRCRYCGKPIPMKDPNAEKFGAPDRCPHCKVGNLGT